MATFRGTIPDFQLANPIYVGAQVSFFTVDEDGLITTTLATLYADAIGTQTLSNPQTLDSEGKFERAVYIAGPVIGSVVGPNVGSHDTGVINARGTWRGDWTTATVYFATDFIADPISGNIYGAADDFVSSGSLATDVSAGHLVVVIDQVAIITGGGGLAIKQACRVATTANITLSGLQAIDGYTTLAGDRVLVKNETDPTQNGIWNAAAGAWTRATDMEVAAKFGNGCIVYVLSGTLHHNKGFQLSIGTPFTLGTTAVTWVALEFPYSSIPVQFSSALDTFLAAGAKGYVNIPFDCTISSNTVMADAVGSCVIDVQKTVFPTVPTTADTICAFAKPTLTAAQFSRDSTLTGWTLALLQGDVLGFEIISVSGLKSVMLTLAVNRN